MSYADTVISDHRTALVSHCTPRPKSTPTLETGIIPPSHRRNTDKLSHNLLISAGGASRWPPSQIAKSHKQATLAPLGGGDGLSAIVPSNSFNSPRPVRQRRFQHGRNGHQNKKQLRYYRTETVLALLAAADYISTPPPSPYTLDPHHTSACVIMQINSFISDSTPTI